VHNQKPQKTHEEMEVHIHAFLTSARLRWVIGFTPHLLHAV